MQATRAASLRGLDVERLGDRRELGALLGDAGGKLGRSAHLDDLAGGGDALRDHRIGRQHGAEIGGDPFAQIERHAARAERTDQAFELQRRKSRLAHGRHQRAFEAADLFRRFSAFTGLAQLDDIVNQFKLTDIVDGVLGRFGIGR